jgi:hypothetical protein
MQYDARTMVSSLSLSLSLFFFFFFFLFSLPTSCRDNGALTMNP